MKWLNWNTGIVLVLSSLLLACSTPPLKISPPLPPLVRCPDSLPLLTDGTAGDVALTMAEWAAIFHDCRINHNGLVDALTR